MNRVSRAAEGLISLKRYRKRATQETMKAAKRVASAVQRIRAGQTEERQKLFGLAALGFYLIVVALFGWITWENWQGRERFGVNFLPQAQEGVGSLTFRGLELMPVRK